MNLLPMLGAWQWAILGAIPAGILALYFLKLKRMPLEVPSTFLWRRAIEDMRVNSFWQKLRKSLLLFLQLLFMALLLMVLLRPGWRTTRTVNSRQIFLIDTSASMSARDVTPTRLDQAKERALELIDEMDSDSVAMVLSFSDSSRVEKSFSGSRNQLREAVKAIQPSQHTTNLLDALRQAAGLANPGKAFISAQSSDIKLAPADSLAEGVPATVFIFSDGRFPDVQGFSLGNLTPKYVPIGDLKAKNVAVTTFSVRRNPEKNEELQAFASIENFGKDDVRLKAELFREGKWWDSTNVTVKGESTQPATFDLVDTTQGVLEIRLDVKDDLDLDNRAFAIIQPPKPLQVLLVSEGNKDLERAFGTDALNKLVTVGLQTPAFLEKPEYTKGALAGGWDLIIYDRCAPKEMPRANTFFFGALPPKDWTLAGEVAMPVVFDINRSHLITQNVDFHNVLIANAIVLGPPKGATRLFDSTKGLIGAISPREGFEDFVLGFGLVAKGKDGANEFNSNFQIRPGFPLMVQNLLGYFSKVQDTGETISYKPGSMLEIRQEGADQLTIESPSGKKSTVNRSTRNTFPFSATDEVGVYKVLLKNALVQQFSVNLFDSLESKIPPVKEGGIQIGYNEVAAENAWQAGRYEFWKWILLAAFCILLAEWYIYNRRVFI